MATSADWNMWLGQGQNRQVDPLAPLNQQFGGSLTGAPAQGYGQTSINMPASEWSRWGAPTEGNGDRLPFSNFYSMNNLDPGTGGGSATPTAPPSAPALVPATQPQVPTPQKATPPVPQLVNPKTGGAGGTPTATGWTDTSAQSQTVAPPGATGVFANDQWVNEAGNRFDYGDATQAPGRARAGTALAKGAVKTWVNYDGSRDTQLHEGGETSWRRVNRWTQEGVAEHGLTPQEAHNAALARLKRDFELTNLDWRNSGFDLSNVQSAAPGQDWAKANAVGAVPSTTPTLTPGVVPKIADSNVPGFVPGKTAPTPQQPGVDPKTGLPQTEAPRTPFTPGKGFFSEADLKQVADDPATALAFWQSRNGGRDKSGAMGAYRDSMMAKALQAYVNTLGVGGNNPEGGVFGAANTGLEDMLGRFQSGQGVGGMLRDNASRMMNGIDFSNMDGDQIQNILNLAAGAATFGAPTMAQYGFDNAAEDLKALADEQYFNGGGKTSVLADPRNRQKFTDLLSQWLQLQQGG